MFFLKRKRLKPVLLMLLGIVIIAEIVALTPSSLEEPSSSNAAVDPDSLIQDNEPSLVPDLPKDRISEYTVEKFHYVSVQNGEKQWRIEADKAFMYNPERLVHSRVVKAFLYDPEGKLTIITGKESRYFMNKKDLELYGDVVTTFPDGFELHSEYLRYKPNERRIVIPTQYFVQGAGQEADGQFFRFKSHGLDYAMGQSTIVLSKNVTVTLDRNQPIPDSPGVPDHTTIESDHCFINRKISLAKFTMDPKRKLDSRFVHITQPTLFARSRRADLNYGSFNQVLNYLTAYEDVLIKETGKTDSLHYATGGRADFDTKRNVIVITQFPQAYEDTNTVTGDEIIMHRDTGLVEVRYSNGYNEGQPTPEVKEEE